MVLSEKARSELYTGFAPIVGDEAASQMLSCFPTREADEPITKEFLRAELLATRMELRDEIRAVDTALRDEIRAGDTALRDEIRAGDTALRDEIRAGDTALRDEIRAGDTALRDEMRSMFHWMMGTMITLTGLLASVVVVAR